MTSYGQHASLFPFVQPSRVSCPLFSSFVTRERRVVHSAARRSSRVSLRLSLTRASGGGMIREKCVHRRPSPHPLSIHTHLLTVTPCVTRGMGMVWIVFTVKRQRQKGATEKERHKRSHIPLTIHTIPFPSLPFNRSGTFIVTLSVVSRSLGVSGTSPSGVSDTHDAPNERTESGWCTEGTSCVYV